MFMTIETFTPVWIRGIPRVCNPGVDRVAQGCRPGPSSLRQAAGELDRHVSLPT